MRPERVSRGAGSRVDMAFTRMAIYLVGLFIVVAAAWIFLTQTPVGASIPAGVALAIILLLVGIGVMAAARAMDDDRFYRRRVTHDGPGYGAGYVAPPPPAPATRVVERETVSSAPGTVVYEPGSSETVVEERRY